MAGKTTIIGIEGLRGKFLELRQDMAQKTSRRMVAAAGGVLKKEAKAIAQSKGLKISGALIRNIAIKRERNAPEGTEQYNLGVRHGRDLGKRHTTYLAYSKRKERVVIRRENDPFYWRFIEFGHKIIARASGKTGFVEPIPFIQPALVNKKEEAIAAMEDRLTKDLAKANNP